MPEGVKEGSLEDLKIIVHSMDKTLTDEDDPSFKTAVVILASINNGTSTDSLVRVTGYDPAYIENIRKNFVQNEIWFENPLQANYEFMGKTPEEDPALWNAGFWLMVLCGNGMICRRRSPEINVDENEMYEFSYDFFNDVLAVAEDEDKHLSKRQTAEGRIHICEQFRSRFDVTRVTKTSAVWKYINDYNSKRFDDLLWDDDHGLNAHKKVMSRIFILPNLEESINLVNPINSTKDEGDQALIDTENEENLQVDYQSLSNIEESQLPDNHMVIEDEEEEVLQAPKKKGEKKKGFADRYEKPKENLYARIRQNNKNNTPLVDPSVAFAPKPPDAPPPVDEEVLKRAEEKAQAIIREAERQAEALSDDAPVDIQEIIRKQNEYHPNQD